MDVDFVACSPSRQAVMFFQFFFVKPFEFYFAYFKYFIPQLIKYSTREINHRRTSLQTTLFCIFLWTLMPYFYGVLQFLKDTIKHNSDVLFTSCEAVNSFSKTFLMKVRCM